MGIEAEYFEKKDIEAKPVQFPGHVHDQNNQTERAAETVITDSKPEVIDNINDGESLGINAKHIEKDIKEDAGKSPGHVHDQINGMESAAEMSRKVVNNQEHPETGEQDCYSENVNNGDNNSNGGGDANGIYLIAISEMLETQKSNEKTQGEMELRAYYEQTNSKSVSELAEIAETNEIV